MYDDFELKKTFGLHILYKNISAFWGWLLESHLNNCMTAFESGFVQRFHPYNIEYVLINLKQTLHAPLSFILREIQTLKRWRACYSWIRYGSSNGPFNKLIKSLCGEFYHFCLKSIALHVETVYGAITIFVKSQGWAMNAFHHSQKNETPPSINQKLSQKGVVEWHLAVNFNLKTTDVIIIIYINACKTVDRHLSPDYIVILWFTAHTICESSFVTTLYWFCHVSSGLLFFFRINLWLFFG